ncbi:uncharacterized protein EV154DRAFT_515285 [Mucor mucedo]|uniref:uncharacterized protein n=1 Tax=Mucor mucedo TaxID=29922 RepID=UPI0022203023|nr:uncharacterized protein EV154DRAFT_515285 [Mucor mucedo]KAI7889201.1 hypothetical protein EV154DRAFT_515285 [Mucor mucedo]
MSRRGSCSGIFKSTSSGITISNVYYRHYLLQFYDISGAVLFGELFTVIIYSNATFFFRCIHIKNILSLTNYYVICSLISYNIIHH